MTRHRNWFAKDQENASSNVPAQYANAARALPFSPSSYFGPLSNFYHDVDKMFEQAFRNFGLSPALNNNLLQKALFTPNVDISSTDKEYTIEVEVPGLSKEDIRINLSRDGQLCICGEKRLENDNQEKDFHRIECSYGAFSRTLSLPEDVDPENIQADCSNGILTITAPRVESAASQGRRIEVQSNENANLRSGKQHRNRQDAARQDNAAHNQSSQGHRAA